MDFIDNRLLKTQENDIAVLVRDCGIPAKEFTWKDVSGTVDDWGTVHSQFSRLVHLPSGFYCTFGKRVDFWRPVVSPGYDERVTYCEPTDWDGACLRCSEWLERLRAERNAPDLWSEIRKATGLSVPIAANAAAANAPFSPEEQQTIVKAVGELKAYIQQHQTLTGEQIQAIATEMSELSDAVKRLGRRDWMRTLLGTVTNLVLRGVLSTPIIQGVMGEAKRLFGWVLSATGMLSE